MLRIALQKSGRMTEDALELMRSCDLEFELNRGRSQLKLQVANFPVEFLLLRDDDIPGYVADGVADLGIVGENVFLESGAKLEIEERLGFSKCRLSVAAPKEAQISKAAELNGKKIATSYPKILRRWLDQEKIRASIHQISGSVEVAPGIGLTDAIFDVVGTGSTLLLNGLKEIVQVIHSEAVLVASSNFSKEKRALWERLRLRVRSVKRAKHNKYILLNAPDRSLEMIISLLPGLRSPTVVPLAENGWSSVHAVVRDEDFWEIIERLKQAGAQGILVAPLEKMIE